MDMMPDICPWARRLIQKNTPTKSEQDDDGGEPLAEGPLWGC